MPTKIHYFTVSCKKKIFCSELSFASYYLPKSSLQNGNILPAMKLFSYILNLSNVQMYCDILLWCLFIHSFHSVIIYVPWLAPYCKSNLNATIICVSFVFLTSSWQIQFVVYYKSKLVMYWHNSVIVIQKL